MASSKCISLSAENKIEEPGGREGSCREIAHTVACCRQTEKPFILGYGILEKEMVYLIRTVN